MVSLLVGLFLPTPVEPKVTKIVKMLRCNMSGHSYLNFKNHKKAL